MPCTAAQVWSAGSGSAGVSGASETGETGHYQQNTRPPRLWNAGFIRQPGEPRVGLPDESGVPVAVPDCARERWRLAGGMD